MLVKGLLSLIGGFLFIFASGLPMRLISRFNPDYKREGMYWGMGIYVLTFLLGTFIQNLVMQIATGGDPSGVGSILPFLLGTIFNTLLLILGMRIYLKQKAKIEKDIETTGLTLGFGIGMIAQVFTGMILITAGAGLILQGAGVTLAFGALQTPLIETISGENVFGILSALFALILYRVALLIVSAAQGLMVAYSITRKGNWFWIAVLAGLAFPWLILLAQAILGQENNLGQVSLGITPPIQSILIALYYLAVSFFGYRWTHNILIKKVNK